MHLSLDFPDTVLFCTQLLLHLRTVVPMIVTRRRTLYEVFRARLCWISGTKFGQRRRSLFVRSDVSICKTKLLFNEGDCEIGESLC